MRPKVMEEVLYYNPGTTETLRNVQKLKGVLVRMGIRIRNIGLEQVMETVGYLAGIPGFLPRDCQAGEIPGIPEEMLVMKHFTGNRLEELLRNLRKAGVPRIHLKAMLTEHNVEWTFYHLYEELAEEHRKLHQEEQKDG